MPYIMIKRPGKQSITGEDELPQTINRYRDVSIPEQLYDIATLIKGDPNYLTMDIKLNTPDSETLRNLSLGKDVTINSIAKILKRNKSLRTTFIWAGENGLPILFKKKADGSCHINIQLEFSAQCRLSFLNLADKTGLKFALHGNYPKSSTSLKKSAVEKISDNIPNRLFSKKTIEIYNNLNLPEGKRNAAAILKRRIEKYLDESEKLEPCHMGCVTRHRI
jgi:hypothetical protein